jgi:hypothetical protein
MQIYEYRCRNCGEEWMNTGGEPMACGCGATVNWRRSRHYVPTHHGDPDKRSAMGVPAFHPDSFPTGLDGFGKDDNRRRFVAEKFSRDGVAVAGMYQKGLARFPNDPRAFVGSRSEFKRRCQELGRGCEELGIEPPDVPIADPEPFVADDIVERETRATIRREKLGKVRGKERQKIKELTRQRLMPATD